MVLGLAFVAVSVQAPTVGESGNMIMNSPDMHFLLPVSTTVTLGDFNGTATLLVQAVDSRLNVTTSVLDIQVHGLEAVIFSVPARGFYTVELNSSSGGDQSVTFSLYQNGVPLDSLGAGVALIIVGGLVLAYPWWKKRVIKGLRGSKAQ